MSCFDLFLTTESSYFWLSFFFLSIGAALQHHMLSHLDFRYHQVFNNDKIHYFNAAEFLSYIIHFRVFISSADFMSYMDIFIFIFVVK